MTHDYKRQRHRRPVRGDERGHRRRSCYDTRKRHTGDDVLAFFKLIDLHVPTDLGDPCRVGQPVRAHERRTRHRVARSPQARRDGTCTSLRLRVSWLNLVERWFKELTRQTSPTTAASPASPSSPKPSSVWAAALERQPPIRSYGPRPPKRSSTRSSTRTRHPPTSIHRWRSGEVMRVSA